MRLIVARCEVRYSGRLNALLPEALGLIMVKALRLDGQPRDTGGNLRAVDARSVDANSTMGSFASTDHARPAGPTRIKPLDIRPSVIDTHGLGELQQRSYERRSGGMASAWPPESAMSATELGAFLGASSFCVFATAGPGMRPLARPVAFVLAGTALWIASGEGARLRHLRESRWASAVIMEGGRGAHRGVVMDGPVEVTGSAPDDVRRSYAGRHRDPDGWAVAWCALNPVTVYSYHYPSSKQTQGRPN